ncbi:1-acyl-sn-glycerol-3-phosphate acyltransferase [Saccharomonospora marina XMU15]|uniref:1-acyl-sn-glycerol-3-phosphate acyltransferase n=1 Tax=Saccharomonospora marina XMU15 TaxID=882083 RepID=H5X2S9_9PSEU|nr:lysophospholipid acyltransferase family protein [Saccharomonospora marina]EHR52071.1 1-acyl-sn-glycerol-3-phosphate acyltransferase [Saccharomonospora marina XMU15]
MDHVWMPVSPCGPGCLTRDEPVVGLPRRVVRFARAAAVLCVALLLAPCLAALPAAGRRRAVRLVFRGLLAAFEVRLVVHGELDSPGRGALVVNNHISWLDIVAVNAVRPMRALAKREIARWPVLGRLVSRSGSIYLDRGRLSTLPATVARVAAALREGSLVNVTPEGTTWCGSASGRFRPALFQAAIDGGVGVVPVALRYRSGDGRQTTWPAFVGTESLIESLRRVARLRGLVLELFVCPEIAPGRAADRAELARLAQAAVHAALGTTQLVRPARGRVVRPVRPVGSLPATV